jgi:hypothetical protein
VLDSYTKPFSRWPRCFQLFEGACRYAIRSYTGTETNEKGVLLNAFSCCETLRPYTSNRCCRALLVQILHQQDLMEAAAVAAALAGSQVLHLTRRKL